jgi:hypothetical protein
VQILDGVRLSELREVVVVGSALILAAAAARRLRGRLAHVKGSEVTGSLVEVEVRSKLAAGGKTAGVLVFVASEGSRSKCRIGCSALGAGSWVAACMRQPELGSKQCD